MRSLPAYVFMGVVCLSALPLSIGYCGDYSDGISFGDGISTGNDLKKNPNTRYLRMKAKAKADRIRRKAEDDSAVVTQDDVSGHNIGSVVNSEVEGDVIIIIEDDSDITVVE